MPRILRQDDLLYRVIVPEHIDDDGTLLREAFIDKYNALSLWAIQEGRPSQILAFIAMRSRVRKSCGTGRIRPTPKQMYDKNYRVARLLGAEILTAISTDENTLSIITDANGNEISPDGHLDLLGGQALADIWARKAVILSESETF